MSIVKTIFIAKDFSTAPGGRFAKHGPFSGEEFRRDLLKPAVDEAFKTGGTVEVILDGTAGYAGSFLEEAFGGLVRAGLNKEWLINHINVIAETPRYHPYKQLALQYLKEA